MTDGRTHLEPHAKVFTDAGVQRVVHVSTQGVQLLDIHGNESLVAWTSLPDLGQLLALTGSRIDRVHESLQPWWAQRSEQARQETLDKLEVVQEILTGYRDGHEEFARPGEPRWPHLDDDRGSSVAARARVMASTLKHEWEADRQRQRDIAEGGRPRTKHGESTIRGWAKAFREHGLRGLCDDRRSEPGPRFASMDLRWKVLLDAEIDKLDGDISTVNNDEIIRRAAVVLNESGDDVKTPQRVTGQYVSWRLEARGRTTRAQASTSSRSVSGYQHYPAVRVGQVVAIDVTRADNLVWDTLHERPMSVEIISAIDVCTRVVLALRVVPMSADAIDASLLIYDTLRPFHLHVEGTTVSDWRWAGLPGALDLGALPLKPRSGKGASLEGTHQIPGVHPTAISSDRGSIFLARLHRILLDSLGIDLLTNRAGKPTDNAYVERWHETLQRGIQQLAGYKGRNPSQRGRIVATEPLVTAVELQAHLRRFVALDYHRSQHTGLVLPGAPTARLSPLEMFDAILEATGEIDVPTNPDLLYEFLPIRWGVIGHAGVEFNELVYDAEVLNRFRSVPRGTSQLGGDQAPFFWDPHDVSRVWFRHPETSRVHEVPWRGADMLLAPMTETILQEARGAIRRRGGNRMLTSETGRREILNRINELAPSPRLAKADKRRVSAAHMRVSQSQTDHAEAQEAIAAELPDQPVRPPSGKPSNADSDVVTMWSEAWPDLDQRSA